MLEARPLNSVKLFKYFNPLLAQRRKRTVGETGLPMVNAGARNDIEILLMSGAHTGIFVDLKDRSDWLTSDIKRSNDAIVLSVSGMDPRPRDIRFRYNLEDYRILYYRNDVKNLAEILGEQKIAFYYNAFSGGPEIIPEAAFNALVKWGFLISPRALGNPNTCFERTGLKMVSELTVINEI